MSLAINPIESIKLQMGKPKKVPYYQVVLVVLEVVDLMLSSSTIRDFHKNSFQQDHCDGTRKLYTNSGVHTVRSPKFHVHPGQMNSTATVLEVYNLTGTIFQK
jgi:hypothetical protein